MRYFAVEFFKGSALEHNGVMTPNETFDYLMQAPGGENIRLVVAHEVPADEAEQMTREERGLGA